MAGSLKRLRRKSPVSQRNYEDVLVPTFPLWIPYLLPPDTPECSGFCCTWSWVKHERLLSKGFREAWNEHFQVILLVRYDCLELLGTVVPSDDGSCTVLGESFYIPWRYRDTHYLVRMPWHACKLVMAIWRMRSGFPVTRDGFQVCFLDACSKAKPTPATECPDIREEINWKRVLREWREAHAL